jgi:hypothetical protein
MSANGPIGYPGTRPPMRRPTDDPYTTPPTGQPQQPHWPPRYADPAPQPQPAYGQQPSYPQQPGYSPHGGQQAYGQDAQGQQTAPGYFFPQAAQEAPGYAPPSSSHQLPFGNPALGPAPGYAPAAQHAQTVPRRPDPQGYDLGNYMPATAPTYAPAEAEAFQQPHEHDPAHFGAPHQGYGENDADFDEMLAEEEEQPRRGRRGMMIAAALVGAIGLGGAMAYTYKSLVAPGGGRAPVIKAADFGPNKVKPEMQDGKVVPHTDKKLLNRLGEEGTNPPARIVVPTSAPSAADASDDPNGPRKVKVIPIPTGSPPPATTASAPPRPSGPPLVAVPGVMLETGMPQMPSQGPPPSAARVTLPAPAQSAPVRAMPSPPPVKSASAAKAPPAAEAAAPARAPVVKTPVPKKTAAVDAPVATSTSASGYVAVLSSKKSRMDALKAFADIQQKYGDVLASKTPDVQEADLGDKGLWYRAVVGPPGSRDAASAVCSQLKTAGHTGCWVTAY